MIGITILGSTGTIGINTLDVIARHPERFRVFALTANRNVKDLLAQCITWRPAFAVMVDAQAARELRTGLKEAGVATEVLDGETGLCTVAAHPETGYVMAGIVGAAGLLPNLAAARAGKRVMLANKESLVMSGQLFINAVRENGAELLPIDSEHNAIFQCMPSGSGYAPAARGVSRILLTASGGPFRTRELGTLDSVTPDEACAHPKWVMGRKISVDSATMMNKGLEIIEACWLFNTGQEAVEVVVHPQSVIHSMVQYRDNSVVAQLGTPDMRVPIAYGLSWPERVVSGAQALDFSSLADMSFESLDTRGHRERFPGLRLAWESLAGPSGTTAVLNAANEVAVEAFLAGRIRFDQIHALNLATLEAVAPSAPHSLDDLLAIDAAARRAATQAASRLA